MTERIYEEEPKWSKNQELGALLLKAKNKRKRNKSKERRIINELFEANKYLVDKIAERFFGDLREDLLQTGLMKLFEILPEWNPHISSLPNYSYKRIHTAMARELKSMTSKGFSHTRFALSYVPGIKAVENELMSVLKRKPTEQEITDRYNATKKRGQDLSLDVLKAVNLVMKCSTYSCAEKGNELANPNYESPLESELKKEMLSNLSEILSNGFLREREKYVIIEHYFKNRTLEDIKSDLGITRQRVEQIHYKAVTKMQEILKEKYPEIEIRKRKKHKAK